jgi:hypothetical protein
VLRPQDAAEPLRLLLPAAERAGHLDRDVGVRQVDREVADLADDQLRQLALAERGVEAVALDVRRLPGDQRQPEHGRQVLQLFEVLADHQHAVVLVPMQQGPHHVVLAFVVGGDADLLARASHRVLLGARGRQRHAHLDAARRGEEALPFELLPRQLVALGPDQREHLVGAAVLAHQRRREAEPPARLDAGGGAEHRGRQQVHLVVDDQPEAALVEQVEVRERVELALAVRQDLVGRDGHRPDLLLLAGVLADLVGAQVGLVEDLAAPLPHRHRVGGQHQRIGLQQVHRGDADHGLAGPARQHHDAAAAAVAAAGVERLGGGALVVAQGERPGRNGTRTSPELERQRVAGAIAGAVVDRIAELAPAPA